MGRQLKIGCLVWCPASSSSLSRPLAQHGRCFVAVTGRCLIRWLVRLYRRLLLGLYGLRRTTKKVRIDAGSASAHGTLTGAPAPLRTALATTA